MIKPAVSNPYAPPRADLAMDLGPYQARRHGLLRVERTVQFSDMLRRYRIEVDGQPRARVRMGAETEIPLEPGDHQLVIRMDWFSSPAFEFHIAAGEIVNITCGSAIRGLRMWLAGFYGFYYLFHRDQYIRLSAEGFRCLEV